MDDIPLCQLLQRVFQTREGSYEHENAKEALALAIDQLPEVKRYLGKGLLPYYDKALPVTMRDIRRNIGKFPTKYDLQAIINDYEKPENAKLIRRKFINWVVMILKYDCHDVKRGRHNLEVSLDTPLGEEVDLGTLQDSIMDDSTIPMDMLIDQENKEVYNRLLEYIKEDPDQILRQCRSKSYPKCNCQAIFQQHLLEGKKLTEIAQEQDIPVSTLGSHWTRKCKPMLQEILKEWEG